jgi:hypothetical protein
MSIWSGWGWGSSGGCTLLMSQSSIPIFPHSLLTWTTPTFFLPDSQHYFASNVLSDNVDGAPDNNRFLGPSLQAVYLFVAVHPT